MQWNSGENDCSNTNDVFNLNEIIMMNWLPIVLKADFILRIQYAKQSRIVWSLRIVSKAMQMQTEWTASREKLLTVDFLPRLETHFAFNGINLNEMHVSRFTVGSNRGGGNSRNRCHCSICHYFGYWSKNPKPILLYIVFAADWMHAMSNEIEITFSNHHTPCSILNPCSQ